MKTTVKILREQAKAKGLKGYSKLRKQELITLLKRTNKVCTRGKIRNPSTGRCVSKTGKIGKALLKGRSVSWMDPIKSIFVSSNKKDDKTADKTSNKHSDWSGDRSGARKAKLAVKYFNNDVEWVVVTMNGCGYCKRAKELLKSNSIKYKTIQISDDEENKFYLVLDSYSGGYRKFPMIFRECLNMKSNVGMLLCLIIA